MERYAAFYARIALGSAFLSAVAARFGLWDDRADPFGQFIRYTGEVNSFMPASTIPSLAIAATVAETFLGIVLIAGLRLRRVALVSAALLALFGMAMTISFGIKSALDASVFSASAGALLLALEQRVKGALTVPREDDRPAVELAPRPAEREDALQNRSTEGAAKMKATFAPVETAPAERTARTGQ